MSREFERLRDRAKHVRRVDLVTIVDDKHDVDVVVDRIVALSARTRLQWWLLQTRPELAKISAKDTMRVKRALARDAVAADDGAK